MVLRIGADEGAEDARGLQDQDQGDFDDGDGQQYQDGELAVLQVSGGRDLSLGDQYRVPSTQYRHLETGHSWPEILFRQLVWLTTAGRKNTDLQLSALKVRFLALRTGYSVLAIHR